MRVCYTLDGLIIVISMYIVMRSWAISNICFFHNSPTGLQYLFRANLFTYYGSYFIFSSCPAGIEDYIIEEPAILNGLLTTSIRFNISVSHNNTEFTCSDGGRPVKGHTSTSLKLAFSTEYDIVMVIYPIVIYIWPMRQAWPANHYYCTYKVTLFPNITVFSIVMRVAYNQCLSRC